MKKTIIILALALAVPALSTLGQDERPAKRGESFKGAPGGGPSVDQQNNDSDEPHHRPPGGPGHFGHRPPPPPLLVALDPNHDGIIDATEIAQASDALKKLDKNGDGQLTRDELRPPFPPDGPPPGDGQFSPDGPRHRGPRPDGENNSPDGEKRHHVRPQSEDGSSDGEPRSGSRGPRDPRGPRTEAGQDSADGAKGDHKRFVPPIIAALDANHDGVIDETELANATEALKKLDKDGNGKLEIREVLPPPPHHPRPPGPPEDE